MAASHKLGQGRGRPPTPVIYEATEVGIGENRQPVQSEGEARRGEAFVSRLTAEGRGAIAVLRLWGPGALEVADTVFRPHRGARLAETRSGRLRLGRIGRGPGDEVVVVVLEGDPPAVEVQCHGGAAAIALVVEAFQAAGARTANGDQLALYLSDGPLARDALVDLTRAPTVPTAEILLDQAHGALRDELVRLGNSIADEPDRALAEIETLIDRARVGTRLLEGWRVVIAGRPNVGKSRLFNGLVGFGRAIVDSTPGTTRDVVSLRVVIGGWPVELADTAGLREAFDSVESIGIERSRREQQQADLVLLVLDRSLPLQSIDHELIAANPAAIVAANKLDLAPAWYTGDSTLRSSAIITVSAETGEGLPDLIEMISRKLVPDPPAPGAAVPFRLEQVEELCEIRLNLLSGDRAKAARDLAAMIR
jgi:tRNA modification GTPase